MQGFLETKKLIKNMKKIILAIAIVLGITLGASAQNGGLFGMGPQRGEDSYDYSNREGEGSLIGLNLPSSHGKTGDQGAPLGSGALLLIGFGAAYALKKKNK